ncbi:hypothetical protein GZH47_32310 (plasmid) [Paenibacillus rhizovicinus]|uniref:Uncharacterized protein n=1 Tax=Paenibacillus rhizovicinus TaxID=2704463 RepID=A0A6C0PAF6_9BACL|nr:hypothetical protein [Paenibacillus rhizovicinus]QHW35570.1 hypothetical protein GZH47_32310 [Paenibacillus rhizovicinus]
MRINLSRLKESLPTPTPYLQEYTSGLFRAIEFAHNTHYSDEVDWNSFTLEEAMLAMEMACAYEGVEGLDGYSAGDRPNEGNAIHELLLSQYTIRALKAASPEKRGEDVEFF